MDMTHYWNCSEFSVSCPVPLHPSPSWVQIKIM